MRFSAIIPSHNEALTIAHVVSEVLKVPHLDEVIVVNDGSTDNTKEVLSAFESDKRFVSISHEKNRGKGAALLTGLKKARNEVVLFLDADLKNITHKKIARIVNPVLNNEVDLARASFSLRRGRVTEIAVKPMMHILFPNHDFDQPITGQICGKKDFLSSIDFYTKWGVDIGILLDAIAAGLRIQEFDIGKLEHKERSPSEKAEMAQQVLETMIQKAGLIGHKYKLIIFTLDQTLLQQGSISSIFSKLHMRQQLVPISKQLESNEISYATYLTQAAKLFKGKTMSEVQTACEAVRFEPYVHEVLKALRQRRFKLAIVTPGLSPIPEIIAKELGITSLDSVVLKKNRMRFTGELTERAKQYWLAKDIDTAMVDSAKRVARQCGVKLSESVIVANAERALPIFQKAGLSLAYRTKSPELRHAADKTISVLAEVLALIE